MYKIKKELNCLQCNNAIYVWNNSDTHCQNDNPEILQQDIILNDLNHNNPRNYHLHCWLEYQKNIFFKINKLSPNYLVSPHKKNVYTIIFCGKYDHNWPGTLGHSMYTNSTIEVTIKKNKILINDFTNKNVLKWKLYDTDSDDTDSDDTDFDDDNYITTKYYKNNTEIIKIKIVETKYIREIYFNSIVHYKWTLVAILNKY